MNENVDTLYWYARSIGTKDKLKVTNNIKIIYLDKQNYNNCIDFLEENGFHCVLEDYDLTGRNDLYQYKFVR